MREGKQQVRFSVFPVGERGNSTDLAPELTIRVLDDGANKGWWEVEDEDGRTARHAFLLRAILEYLTKRVGLDDESLEAM